MPTYIMLTTLTPEGVQTVKNNPARINEVNKEVESLGATVTAQWAALGRFDFVNVVEAPDEKTMARVSMELGSRGTAPLRVARRDPDRRVHRRPVRRAVTPRVLVVGGGGREHALVRALGAARSGRRCSPRPATRGSRATASSACRSPSTTWRGSRPRPRAQGSTSWWSGPEAPLVAGLVDMLGEAGIRAFGPIGGRGAHRGLEVVRQAADARARHADGVVHAVFRTREEALAQLPCASYPAVLKADVLAAGKGVIVCPTEPEARAAVDVFFGERRFGADDRGAGGVPRGRGGVAARAVRRRARGADGARAGLQAHLRRRRGPEHRRHGQLLAGAGLRRRLGHGDRRRRAPADRRRPARARHAVPRRPLRGPDDHRGRPKVLEYNARFGDPETQAILPRLRSDLLELLDRAARPGGLEGASIEWSRDWAVTLVLASRGYPESASKGDAIEGLDDLPGDVEVLHAGTADRDGAVVTNGGRVLNVTGARRDAGRGPRARVRRGGPDRVRWQATAPRHSRARRGEGGGLSETVDPEEQLGTARGAPVTETSVEEEFAALDVDSPLVGIVMGSKSDMPVMEKAARELDDRGIRNELRVMSAHRDPDTVAEYAKNARMRGLRVIIAGAGLAAALPGVVAAHTDLPVIGVPLTSSTSVAGGLDALLAIAQMPPGRARRVRGRGQREERGGAGGADPGWVGTGRAWT